MSDQVAGQSMPAEEPVRSGVWATFRDERVARELSIGDVSSILKLAPRQIEALEKGDVAALPGAAFARGFVRNYARFLDLDPAPFLAAIDARLPEVQSGVVERIPASGGLGRMPSRRGSRFSSMPAAIVVVVLLGVLSLGWYYEWFEPREEKDLLAALSASQPVAAEASVAIAKPAAPAVAVLSPVTAAPAPVATASAPAVAQSVPATPRTVPLVSVSTPVADKNAATALPRLVLEFAGESWVEVRDANGKIIFSRLNQPGSTQEIQGNAPFSLVIGNGTKVKLNWKGKAVDLASSIKNDVARITVQ